MKWFVGAWAVAMLIVWGGYWTMILTSVSEPVPYMPPIVDDSPGVPPAGDAGVCGCGDTCECDDGIARRRPKR